MTFIFRNRTIFWDISKWNKGQKKWDGGSNNFFTIHLIYVHLKLEIVYFNLTYRVKVEEFKHVE